MPLECIRVSDADTGNAPDFGSTGSRIHLRRHRGQAGLRDVKRKLYQLAHEKFGVPRMIRALRAERLTGWSNLGKPTCCSPT